MPKYKVGDVAALFSTPKEPTTEAGKKLQSLFKEFHNKKSSYHDKNKEKMSHEKSETEKPENERISKKNKKRKFSDVISSDSVGEQNYTKKFKKGKEMEETNNAKHTGKKNKFLSVQNFPRNKKASKVAMNNFEANETYDSEQESDNTFKFKNKSKKNNQVPRFIKKSKQVKIAFTNQPAKSKYSEKMPQKHEQDSDDALLVGEIKDFMKKNSKNLNKKNYTESENTQNFQTNSGAEHRIESQDDEEINGEHSFNSRKNNKKLKKKSNSFDQTYSPSSSSNANHKHKNQDDEKSEELTEEQSFTSSKTSAKHAQDFVRNNKRNVKKMKNTNASYVKNPELDASTKEELDFIKIPGIKSFQHTHKKHSKEDEEDRLSRTLFVGNLPVNTSQKNLKTLFSKFGEIENIRYQGVETNKAKIYSKDGSKPKLNAKNYAAESVPGFVVFKDRENAVSALILSGSMFQGHHITVDFALPTGTRKMYDDKRSIFIGNLSFDCKDESIWEAFAQCGKIDNVRIVRDKNTGISKGFGFVQFTTVQSKENALALEDVNIQGRDVRIKPIESSKDAQKKSNDTNTVKRDSFKSKAIRLKMKNKDSGSRKSVKKIMKKQKNLHEKKKISNILQKSMKKK